MDCSNQTEAALRYSSLDRSLKKVVILHTNPNVALTEDETSRIKQAIISANTGEHSLKFSISQIVPPGWILITCEDQVTKDWLLDWKPVDLDLRVVRYYEAPWPTKIVFYVKSNVERLHEVLVQIQTQNPELKADEWKHLTTQKFGIAMFRYTFLISSDALRVLKEKGMHITYQKTKLKVKRLTLL